jgi:hypothetical protein
MMGTFVFADYADDISRQGDAYRPARAARASTGRQVSSGGFAIFRLRDIST